MVVVARNNYDAKTQSDNKLFLALFFVSFLFALLTGSNRGIGLATAKALASRGAHVVLTCRTLEKCQPAVDLINSKQPQHGSASAAVLNLNSLTSAVELSQQLVQEYPEIHYVFCNAGTTPHFALTEEGLEDAFGGMHLAHVALVLGLMPSLRRAGETSKDPSRVVMVSSEMAINYVIGVFGNGYSSSSSAFNQQPQPLISWEDLHGEITRGDGSLGNSLQAYARAKLCNILFAMELNRRMVESDWPVRANAVHTGAVDTASAREGIQNVFHHFPGLPWLVGHVYLPILFRQESGGARMLLCAAFSKADTILRGGQYLDALCHPFLPSEETYSITLDDDDEEMMDTVSINLPGRKTGPLIVFKDAIQALQVADAYWSEPLWNMSLSLLQNSPAKKVVSYAP